MMKFKNLPIIVLLFASGCSRIQETTSQAERATYFVSIPITETTPFHIPCINVEIEGKTLLTALDLGFRGHIAIAPEEADSITSKSFLGEKTVYGVRGKKYNNKKYRIPKLKIGERDFFLPVLQEDNPEFLKDATFLQNKTEITSKEPGRLGWELFSLTPLLIDVQNSRIAFCDSLETLKKEGYSIETFVKAPLFLERGLVEFEACTPNGSLRCMLDTGTTWNVLNDETIEEIDKAIGTPENEVEYSAFLIEGTDFGSIVFRRIPIQIPIKIEAILGMEFIQKHLIFLDCENRSIYFQPRT
jgi:hypothetical protein